MNNGKKRRRRIIIGVVAVLALATAGTIAAVSLGGGSAAPEIDQGAKIYEVRQVSYSQTIEASGNIEAYQAESYVFAASGKIEAILVGQGDAVATGQLLAVLDDDSLQYELAQIDYSISQKRSSASPRELELLEMQRDMILEELDETQLESDFDGTVSEVYVDAGDTVSQGREILRVIDVSAMAATVAIDEIDAPLIAEGQRVEFIFDAYPDLRYNGYVSSIPREARVTGNGIAVLDVELILSDPDDSIKPAFTFTAEIFVNDAEDILVIDKNAVINAGADSSMGMALLYSDDTPQPVRIGIEEYDNDNYRVISGLEIGQRLLPPQSLMEGEGGDGGLPIPLPGMRAGGGDRMPGGAPPPGTGGNAGRNPGGN
jgi:multidrug efflux pump subunit AcrA (membrane-fusion protein)